MKKIIALAMASLLAISLVACGEKKDKNVEETPVVDSPAVESPAVESPADDSAAAEDAVALTEEDVAALTESVGVEVAKAGDFSDELQKYFPEKHDELTKVSMTGVESFTTVSSSSFEDLQKFYQDKAKELNVSEVAVTPGENSWSYMGLTADQKPVSIQILVIEGIVSVTVAISSE